MLIILYKLLDSTICKVFIFKIIILIVHSIIEPWYKYKTYYIFISELVFGIDEIILIGHKNDISSSMECQKWFKMENKKSSFTFVSLRRWIIKERLWAAKGNRKRCAKGRVLWNMGQFSAGKRDRNILWAFQSDKQKRKFDDFFKKNIYFYLYIYTWFFYGSGVVVVVLEKIFHNGDFQAEKHTSPLTYDAHNSNNICWVVICLRCNVDFRCFEKCYNFYLENLNIIILLFW